MIEKYEIFLSFSGDKSYKFADEIFNLLKKLKIENVFLSKESIEGGDNWLEKICIALDHSKIGIIFFTKDNRNNPWIHLEYGVFMYKKFINKEIDEKKFNVVPVLIDFSVDDWIDNPLKSLNAISFNKENNTEDSLIKLVKIINGSIYDKKDESNLCNKIKRFDIIESLNYLISTPENKKDNFCDNTEQKVICENTFGSECISDDIVELSGNMLDVINDKIKLDNKYPLTSESDYNAIEDFLRSKFHDENNILISLNFLLRKKLIAINTHKDIANNKYERIKITLKGHQVVRLRK